MMTEKPYWLIVKDGTHKTEQFHFESLELAEDYWQQKSNDRSWKFGNEAKIVLVNGRNFKTIHKFGRRFGQWRTIK